MGRRRPLSPHAEVHLAGVLRVFPSTRVTSTWRSSSENTAAGGVPNSFHLTGRAADLVPARGTKRLLLAYLWSQRVTRRCTGPEEVLDEGDHIHVAW